MGPINLFKHRESPTDESRLLTSGFYSKTPHKVIHDSSNNYANKSKVSMPTN